MIKKSQSILEYVIMLTAVVCGIFLGTVGLKTGIENSMDATSGDLDKIINDTDESGEEITYNIPIYTNGETTSDE
ncbi:MAG: hypothetical protein PHP69_04580 [Candidatus Omnitrophica bacterium]|jgi:hypothetical protein|nr:hypothetical protein [Candidatus Omnitrophota bacterium]MDD5081636.1 hypothetical protein [Candidatus Omnitrophota bacterium]MDD5441325.1 hypothetical protein [Candidatus Omnitrophota bacterium]